MPDLPTDRPAPALPPGFVLGTATSDAPLRSTTAARLDEDVTLLKRLGVGGHRFVMSWQRLQPDGHGPLVGEVADLYDRLVDLLLASDISPLVTLHHGELTPPGVTPAPGGVGWHDRATVEAFAEYAGRVAERLGDRVDRWVPIGAPAAVMRSFASLPEAHHLLLAHSRAVMELRAAGVPAIGCANDHSPMWPASDDAADVGATKLFDSLWNGLFLEPMLLGRYPADLAALMDEIAQPGDLALLRQPLDFYGVNYYRPVLVAAAPPDAPMPFELRDVQGYPLTDLEWPIAPESLREWLITVRARFRAALPPLVVTECGAAFADVVSPEGSIDDRRRTAWLQQHLAAVAEACQRGVDVRGLFVRSLLDDHGDRGGAERPDEPDRPRFGLVHVDPDTGVRTPKGSFTWLSDVVRRQSASLG